MVVMPPDAPSRSIDVEDKNISNTDTRSNNQWTRKQKIIMICIGLSHVLSNVAYSVIAPFYPIVAIKHGASEFEIGVIFGIFYLSQFVFSIVFGKLVPIFGAKRTYGFGYVIVATGNILFGCVDMISSTSAFVATSLIIRIITSMGYSAVSTGSLTILALTFHGSMAQPVGNLTACAGLGMVIGPFIGGVLYDVGGFYLPFICLGGTMLVNIIVVMYVLPVGSSQITRNTGSYIAILRVPGVLIGTTSTTIGAFSLSFLEPNLSQDLLISLNLSITQIGLFFLFIGVLYMVGSPTIGFLAERLNAYRHFVIAGYLASVIGYMLTGPWPVGYIPHNIVIICFGVSLLIFGLASGLNAGFQDTINSAVFNGFPEDTRTFSILSGIRSCSYALGAFIGPTIGGVLVQKFDFSTTTLVYGLLSLIFGIGTIAFSLWEFNCGKGRRKCVFLKGYFNEDDAIYSEQTLLLDTNNAS